MRKQGYMVSWGQPGDTLMIASRLNKGNVEQVAVRDIILKQVVELIKIDCEYLGVNNKLFNYEALEEIDTIHLINLKKALDRRITNRADYKMLLDYVDCRNQALQFGDLSIHPIIETYILLFNSDGYSQNAIAAVTGVSQKSICLRVKGLKQEQKYGQVVETLKDMRYFNPKRWLIRENPLTTGLYISEEDRLRIQRLKYLGKTQTEIHELTGISRRAVARWYKAPRLW